MGNQGSRTTVENIFNTHTNIDLEQRVEENCDSTSSNVNRVNFGNGNRIEGGINQAIDSKFSCRMATTLDAVANAEITNEQLNKVKTEMTQEGLNLFQNQNNESSARNVVNNITDISQLQELIKSCGVNSAYLNEVIGGDNNVVIGGINQSILSAVDCILETDASLEAEFEVENKGENDVDTSMKQIGLTMLASCGSSIVIIVIAMVVLYTMSSVGGNNNSGNMMKSLMKRKR